MKKLLFLALIFAFCASNVRAQIVSSSSRSIVVKTEKKEKVRKTIGFIRGGISCMNIGGEGAEDFSGRIGYNFSLGFQKRIRHNGAYWGMDFAMGSRGFKIKDDIVGDMSGIAHNVQFSPFTFGWNIGVSENIHIDPHAGLYISYDFSNKLKFDDEIYDWDDLVTDESSYAPVDAGINVGVGLWFKRFNFDLTYQHGFANVFDGGIEANKANNFLIRVGVAF